MRVLGVAKTPDGFDFLRREGEDLLDVDVGGEGLNACSGGGFSSGGNSLGL